MTLTDYIILPGVIVDVNDPQKHGRIKCMIPGIFDPLSPNEALPWIYPFCMNKYQNFSKPVKGAKVWVLRNMTNEDEYMYINIFEYNECTETLINEKYDNDLEILMSRKTLDDSAQIYYDNEDGIILKVNDNILQLLPNGDFSISNGESTVNSISNKIQLGILSGGDWQPAVKGNNLREYFKEISKLFESLKNAASNDKTMPLKSPFGQLAQKFGNCSEVLSQNVELN